MEPVTWLILAAYGSLVLELLAFPIPSEASTYQIIFKAGEQATPEESALRTARSQSLLAKLCFYFLPTALGVGLFLIPLALTITPDSIRYLAPIGVLDLPAAAWAGAACVLFGRALTFGSVLQLRRQKRSGRLSAAGIFVYSRNPGLVGMYVFYIGNALLFPCWVLLIGFFPYVLNMHRRVLMEENHLSEQIGAEYRVYLASVPRYLGLRLATH